MTRRKPKSNTSWRRIVSIVLSVLLIAYLGYQIYSVNHDVYKTEYAMDSTYYHTMPLQGLILRDETVIAGSADGLLGYCQPSGSKVAAGHTVARVFDTPEQAAAQTRVDEIDRLIQDLSSIKTEGMQITANAQVLDSRINDTINQLLAITDRGTTGGYTSVSDELIQLLNKKQVALGTTGGFQAYIENLKAEKATLQTQIGNANDAISVEKSGYFVNSVDGYESMFAYEKATEISYAQLEEALKTTPAAAGGIGKLVASNEWFAVASVEQSISQHLAVGDHVEITIPILSDEIYRCQVEALTMDYANSTAVLVLRCGQMNSDIAKARIEKIQLRLNTYHGLRVNQSALRVVDGITGVYVAEGIAAKFKPVEILYSDAGFAICAYDTANSGGLKQYDEVIVKGGDLYDGKIIR